MEGKQEKLQVNGKLGKNWKMITHSQKTRNKAVKKLQKYKYKRNKVRFTKMCYPCSLKLSNREERSLVTYIHNSRDTVELTRSSPGSSLSS